MKNCILIILVVCITRNSATAQRNNTIDYKNYLAKHDLVFDTLSTKWEEGVFLGNGSIGVMIYRESANAIRFDLGRTDVTDHRDGINPSIGKARLPIGKFLLHVAADIKKINLRLDLWNAELKGSILTDNGEAALHVILPATKDVIIVNTDVKGYNLLRWEWKPLPAISPFLSIGRDSASKYPANPTATLSEERGVHFHYQPLLAGGSYTTAWKQVGSPNKRTIFITIANAYPNDDSKLRAGNIIRSASLKDLPAMMHAHRNYWHNFYRKSFISIPDKRLESFWYIQQYKMASATRVGSYPIDLMGPWFYISPWPKFWWNLNAQLTYYPFFSSNHIDLVKPMLKMVDDHIDNLAKNVPDPYRHNAAALGRSGPYDMSGSIRVMKGNDSSGSSASLELGNLTWLLHVYYQAYEHTMDRQYLRSLYPVLTRAINYYLHIIEKGNDGKYHLPYTYSPEYPGGITRDANYDLALLRWGAKTLLAINDTLKLNDTLAARWQDVLTHLTAYPQDQYGYRIGRDAAFTQSHRHYSHLLMVYPIYEVNADQPSNRAIITTSLNQWKKLNAAWRGYSYTGSGSIHAMLGEGDSTWKLLNEMMKGRFSIKPNTMYLEAGPVIETPLSAVTTINEMLLQSWGGIIRAFPAIPDAWKDVSFDRLLAKGAFEISASRKNGLTEFIRIRSLAGTPCLFVAPWNKINATGKRRFLITKRSGDIMSIDLRKGEEVILYGDSKPASFVITEGASDGNNNFWGLRKN